MSERILVLDGIVGRCIRDLDFGRRVLENPDLALVDYDLTEDELDDFRALAALRREGDDVLGRWQHWQRVFVSDRRRV